MKDLWKLEWGCELIDLEKGFYVARFYSAEDYNRVLEGEPWIILGHYLTVTKWKPNFRPSLAKITSTLVWLRLPEVPLEYFTKKTLNRIGNAFGRLVKVDNTATAATIGKYVRICVELDLSKPLLPSVHIVGVQTAVEYEGLHQICFQCEQYGHITKDCSQHSMKSSGSVDNSSVELVPTEAESKGLYGPWMMPVYGGRKKQDNYRVR